MKRAARKDVNHDEIRLAFEGLGCSVLSLHRIGDGCPDLLVGIPGEPALNLLVEVKYDRPYRPGEGGAEKGELNDEQVKWHSRWRGQVAVVRDLEEVGRLVKGARMVQEVAK